MAMYSDLVAHTLTGCTFTWQHRANEDEGSGGGGMWTTATTVACTIDGCTFENNTATNSIGGGMRNSGISLLLTLTLHLHWLTLTPAVVRQHL